jgi:hypothetical protein
MTLFYYYVNNASLGSWCGTTMDNFENIKVGIRFVAYDDTHVAEVSDFGMIFSGDKANVIEI